MQIAGNGTDNKSSRDERELFHYADKPRMPADAVQQLFHYANKTRTSADAVRQFLSDSEHLCIFCERAVGLMCEDLLREDFAKLYAFLVEAVQVPQETLEHDLVLEVCEKCSE